MRRRQGGQENIINSRKNDGKLLIGQYCFDKYYIAKEWSIRKLRYKKMLHHPNLEYRVGCRQR